MPTLFLTGSSGALANSVRDKYLVEGWHVAGFARHGDSFLHERFKFYATDATDEPNVERSFASASTDLGVPSALVATVGGVKPWKSVAETPVDDIRALLELNLTSFFLAAKHAMRLMKNGGAIVSIGADSALEPSARKGGYVAAKAGVIALTRVIAEEGKAIGITANCIAPTIIKTESNLEWGDPKDIPNWTKPEDIAAMCFFLSCEAGRAVNGAVIRMPNKM